MEPQNQSTNQNPQPMEKPVKKCKHMPIIIILAILAIGGFSFGGYELWQNTQKDNEIKNLQAENNELKGEKETDRENITIEDAEKLIDRSYLNSVYNKLLFYKSTSGTFELSGEYDFSDDLENKVTLAGLGVREKYFKSFEESDCQSLGYSTFDELDSIYNDIFGEKLEKDEISKFTFSGIIAGYFAKTLCACSCRAEDEVGEYNYYVWPDIYEPTEYYAFSVENVDMAHIYGKVIKNEEGNGTKIEIGTFNLGYSNDDLGYHITDLIIE